MANEEFYDSLEGEYSSPSDRSINATDCQATVNSNSRITKTEILNSSSSTSVLVIKSPPVTSIPRLRKVTNSSLKTQFRNQCTINSARDDHMRDISTLVPLYSGDTEKFNIKCRKCCSSPSPQFNDADSLKCDNKLHASCSKRSLSVRKKRAKSKSTKVSYNKSSEIDIPEVRSRSYLKIFHNRIGYPGEMRKIIRNDTQRSVFGDTQRSSVSLTSTDQFCDAEDGQSDTTSYYLKAINESEQCNREREDNKYVWNASNTSVPPSPTIASDIFCNFTSFNSARCTYKKKTTKQKLYPIPVLGGLGADTERFRDKMELRKRQLQYGQKVSNRNRIKLKELDILRNLKNEIEESYSGSDKTVPKS